MKKKKKFKWKIFVSFLVFNLIFAVLLAPFILFWGPFQALKVAAVGSVETSRHPQVVRAFLSQKQIDSILNQDTSSGVGVEQAIGRQQVMSDPAAGITIEDIQGPNYKGKVMLIKDPTRVKVAVTKQLGQAGERVSDFVKDTGAIAGINAGGFFDPNGRGSGGFPDGITIHDGKVVYNNVGNKNVNIIGIDNTGKLIIGTMNLQEIEAKHIQEAVSFAPNLIVDGRPVVSGDGGWGIAPRTGIGQTADGTIIFVVIDGRQPTWSIGATLRDLMNVFIDYHAVNAVNLDGGSSSEMVYNGKIVNRLWDIFGERYIPDAFVVMPK